MDGSEKELATAELLPPEVLIHIFVFLDPVSIVRSERTCRVWQEIATSEIVWQDINKKLFGGTKLPGKKEGITWKSNVLRTYRSYKKLLNSCASPLEILRWACACGHPVIVGQFLESVAFSELNDTSRNLLHLSVIGGSAGCVELLCLKGVNVNVTDPKGQVPIGIAAQKGLLDIVEVLLLHGAGGDNFAQLLEEQNTAIRSKRRASAKPLLHQAAQGGHLKIVQLLVERAASAGQDILVLINKPDPVQSLTPLHWAAYAGQADMAEYLISLGADVNARATRPPLHQSPILLAMERRHSKTMRILLDHGAILDSPYATDPAFVHAIPKDKDLLLSEQLLIIGEDLSQPLEEHTAATLFHQASMLHSVSLMSAMLRRGADPNWKIMNVGPLHASMYREEPYLPFIRMLLRNGADINQLNHANETPVLHLLSSRWSFTKMRLLQFCLEHGATLTNYPSAPMSPLHAYLKSSSGVTSDAILRNGIRLLISNGATLDDSEIFSAAATKFSTKVLNYLLKQEGAAPNPPAHMLSAISPLEAVIRLMMTHDNFQGLAYHYGQSWNNTLLTNAQVLLEHGADPNRLKADGNPFFFDIPFTKLGILRLLLNNGSPYLNKTPMEAYPRNVIGLNIDFVPSTEPCEPYFWRVMTSLSFYHPSTTKEAKSFVRMLAEYCTDLAWTNRKGQTILSFLAEQRWKTVGKDWTSFLADQIASSTAKRQSPSRRPTPQHTRHNQPKKKNTKRKKKKGSVEYL